MTVEAAPSLRDTLAAAYDGAAAEIPTPSAPAEVTPAPADSPPAVAAPQPAAEPAGGPQRGPDGRFLPKEAKTEPVAPAAAPAPSAPAVEPLKRPSSWKAELDGDWGSLPRKVQEEIHRREQDAINGIRTYKGEYERAKPILDTLSQYGDMLAQANLQPHEFISRLANAHRSLTSQDKAEKLRAFARFAQEYQIPLSELLVQGDDGKVYLNQTYFQQPQQTPQQPAGLSATDVERVVAQSLARQQIHTITKQFAETKDAAGNPAYPHFENQEVKQAMFGLLQAGFANDLPSAYKAALHLPKFSHLAPAPTPAPAVDAAEQARVAAAARANAVSPRNQTPTEMVTDTRSQTDLRAQLSKAYDQHAGRV